MLLSNTSGMNVYPAYAVEIDRSSAMCITGHRLKSVTPYGELSENLDITVFALRMMLKRYIDNVMDSGYTTLLSGLANGTDLWAAEHALNRKRYTDCDLIGVIPFLKHADKSFGDQLYLLKRVERYADLLIATNPDPDICYGRKAAKNADPSLYRERNYYLVDNSSAVVAFFNEDSVASGTAQTVNYARSRGIPVYSFGIEDVHALIDRAGMDRQTVMHEAMKISFKVPKAPK